MNRVGKLEFTHAFSLRGLDTGLIKYFQFFVGWHNILLTIFCMIHLSNKHVSYDSHI